jgi:spore protease
MDIYSDLLVELIEKNNIECGNELSPSKFSRLKHNITLEKYSIDNKKQSEYYQKEIGVYSLISIPDILYVENDFLNYVSEIIFKELKSLIKIKNSDKVLVVGLGNRHISSDSLGVKSVSKVNITIETKNFPKVMAICPSVLGLTGIETYDIISGVINNVKPTHLILIDSLCASDVSRLCKSIQISNTGLCPGAGIGNKRRCIDKSIVDNIVTIGIPLLIYANTFIKNSFSKNKVDIGEINGIIQTLKKSNKNDGICNILNKIKDVYDCSFEDMIVSTKDVEECVEKLSVVISNAINKALGVDGIKT